MQNYSSLNYILLCDQFYRLNKTNAHSLPAISELSIRLPIKDLIEYLNSYALDSVSEKDAQVGCFFFIFITFLSIPLISLKKVLYRGTSKFEKAYLRINLFNKRGAAFLTSFFLDFFLFYQSFILQSGAGNAQLSNFIKLDFSNLTEANFYSRNLFNLSDTNGCQLFVYLKLKNTH